MLYIGSTSKPLYRLVADKSPIYNTVMQYSKLLQKTLYNAK